MIERFKPFKLLIDEDLSPQIARVISQEFGIEVVHLRDRGLMGATDKDVFNYAYERDFIVVTANIRDFEQLAQSIDLHAGIVFIRNGELKRDEQIEVVRNIVNILTEEINREGDLINRVLYVEIDGSFRFEPMP